MELPYELNLSQAIALVTMISAAVSIIINKLFENWQNKLKHRRLIKEKLIDAKLDACKNAIMYYGTLLNYQYNIKSLLENLENSDYLKLLTESLRNYQEALTKILLEANFHQIGLFYDFYGEDDEIIANNLKNIEKEYFVCINNSEQLNNDRERILRTEYMEVIDEAIVYFKSKIKMVRDDLSDHFDGK